MNWKMNKKSEKIDGLEVLSFGDASQKNVLFLHGGPGVFNYIEELCKSVSSFCHPYCYNQRGSLQTDLEFGILDHLSDLQKIIDQLFPQKRPTIVGHSWGAMLAVLFASQFPAYMNKVILVGSGPLNKSSGSEFTNELLKRFGDKRQYFDHLWSELENDSDDNDTQTQANQYINEVAPYYQSKTPSELNIGPLHWDLKASMKTMLESDALIESNEYQVSVSKISCPLSVIHGSDDPLLPKHLFPIFKKHSPSTKLIEIPDTGHFPWIGKAQNEFYSILKSEVLRD